MPQRPEEPAPSCPTDETVALFLAGELAVEEEASFREHVDQCAQCRGLLVEAGRGASRTLTATRIKPLDLPPKAAVTPGDVISDKYRIDAVLGSGGMGTVFRGWHLGLNRTVAIKMMHPELLSDEVARRFAREARAAASITSDNAVRILDIDRMPNGAPYIVMEHLQGHDLHEVLMSTGPLPWERAVRYVVAACDAVGEAHALGVVHRDLKPHNLFLTDKDVVKVVDFGLAKTLPHSAVEGSSGQTKSTGLVGSPQYMAPEQIRAAPTVDARTDIYALGATLYQLLSGVPPFLGLNLYVLCSRILNNPPAPLSRIRTDVPAPIEAVVLRCLEKAPAARYATVAEMVGALNEAVSAVHAAAQADAARRSRAKTAESFAAPTTVELTMREQDLMTTREPPAPPTPPTPFDVTMSDTLSMPQPPSTDPAPTPRAPRTPRMESEPETRDGPHAPKTVKMPPVKE